MHRRLPLGLGKLWRGGPSYQVVTLIHRVPCLSIALRTTKSLRMHAVSATFFMFRTLERSYDRLNQKPDVKEIDVRFHGFDGNSEPDYLGYTRFLMEREDKYTELAHGEGFGDNLNSHMPTLWRYGPMLREWQKIPISRRYELDADSIARVVAARRSSNG